MVETALRLVLHHGRNNLADVAHLASGRDDNRTRADNLASVGVLLSHGE